MNEDKINYFKGKLLNEKRRVELILDKMEKNDTINVNIEVVSEISFYDNHPADSAGDVYDNERGMALKRHEVSIINKIENALERIEDGTYGKCKNCNKDIPEERLEFIPYAEYCVKCQCKLNDNKLEDRKNRPVEESVLARPFGYGYNDSNEQIEFDGEDSYQSVQRFNRLYNVVEEYDDDDENGYVEPIERISNQQYKNQLPD